MTLRLRSGALVYDWPHFELAMRGFGPYRALPRPWVAIRNRAERLTLDGRGARCEWSFSSDLHLAKIFPSTGKRLMHRAFSDWPVDLRGEPLSSGPPEVSFVIGHRGLERLPHLLATLRSIAGQRAASIECIVVEQSPEPEIAASLPSWVRYHHTPTPLPASEYNRGWAFNAGSERALGRLLIFHDNDMLCPAGYAAEVVARAQEGALFLDLKRFVFYFDEGASNRMFSSGTLPAESPAVIVQNLQGGSVVASRQAFFEIGGFDESFVGWGGEDNEFRERAETSGRVNGFGYLPFIHLWHPAQSGKLAGPEAPAVKRYHELTSIPPAERIRRLRSRPFRPA
jgi:hypothetical protein